MGTMLFKRKGHFIEIGPNGKLGREVQDEYEKAAEIACVRNAPVKITLNITVSPPDSENIGKVCYDVKTTLPTRKSIAYDAEFDKGKVIATAPADIGTLQTSLYLDDEKPVATVPAQEMREVVHG